MPGNQEKGKGGIEDHQNVGNTKKDQERGSKKQNW